MNKDFQPQFEELDKNAFNAWEYKPVITPAQATVDEQLEFVIECQRLRDEARAEGYNAGLQQASQEIDKMKEELSEWLAFIQRPVQLLEDSLNQEIIKTIMWICEQCIGIEITAKPEQLMNLLQDIKKELPSLCQNKQLVMNPEDVEWLKSQLSQKYQDIIAILVADDTLLRGDFYLKSEHSELDGTLKTRLQNLITAHLSAYTEKIIDEPNVNLPE